MRGCLCRAVAEGCRWGGLSGVIHEGCLCGDTSEGMCLLETGVWLVRPLWTLRGPRLSGSTLSFLWGVELAAVTSIQAEGPPQTLCFGPGIRTSFLGRWTHGLVHTFVAWESLGSHEDLESQLMDSSCWRCLLAPLTVLWVLWPLFGLPFVTFAPSEPIWVHLCWVSFTHVHCFQGRGSTSSRVGWG